MTKGLVVSFEKGIAEVCTFALVHLDSKTLQVHNFEVAPTQDVTNNWAMNEHPCGNSKYKGVLKLDSNSIKQRMSKIFNGINLYYVRNKQTLNVLTTVFEIPKSNIYIINQKLETFEGVKCVACSTHNSDSCAVEDAVSMSNFIYNLDGLPINLELAAVEDYFKFKPHVQYSKLQITLPTADKGRCVRHGAEAYSSDSSE
jgi:hypothetical protein